MVFDLWTVCVLVYFSGVVAGTILGDGGFFARIGLALAWPLGPLAFVVVIGILLAASVIAFPVVGGTLVAAAVLFWIFA